MSLYAIPSSPAKLLGLMELSPILLVPLAVIYPMVDLHRDKRPDRRYGAAIRFVASLPLALALCGLTLTVPRQGIDSTLFGILIVALDNLGDHLAFYGGPSFLVIDLACWLSVSQVVVSAFSHHRRSVWSGFVGQDGQRLRSDA
jgi:hypothetical protein